MKKYLIAITATEHAYAEIYAENDSEALEKAEALDYDDLDWSCGESSYEIVDQEECEYPDREAMDRLVTAVKRHNFFLDRDEEGNTTLNAWVHGRIVPFALSVCDTPKSIACAIDRLRMDYHATTQTVRFLNRVMMEQGEEGAIAVIHGLETRFENIRYYLIDLVDDIRELM